MFENNKRGLGVYKKDYGSDECYKYYKNEIKKLAVTEEDLNALLIDKKVYRKICKT